MSVYARELLAVQLGLFQFRSPLRGRTVVVFCDDSTAVHSLRKGGAPGLLSSTPWLRRSCARWSPSPSACLPSSFPGSDTVLTDSLSRPHQLTHPDWSLHMTVFLFLRSLWPVQMFSLPPRPLFVVQFTSPLPGSVVSRHGRVSPDLGQPSGLRVPSGGCHPCIIAKLRASTGTGLTLVTLHWAKRP